MNWSVFYCLHIGKCCYFLWSVPALKGKLPCLSYRSFLTSFSNQNSYQTTREFIQLLAYLFRQDRSFRKQILRFCVNSFRMGSHGSKDGFLHNHILCALLTRVLVVSRYVWALVMQGCVFSCVFGFLSSWVINILMLWGWNLDLIFFVCVKQVSRPLSHLVDFSCKGRTGQFNKTFFLLESFLCLNS